MATPMHVFAEIAAKYGVDSSDDDAIDDFFATKTSALPPEVQVQILSELYARDGEQARATAPPITEKPVE